MHHLSIDLETYSSVPIAKAGAQKYISSPDFEILLFAYSVDGAPVEIIDLARGERLPPWLVQAITSPEYIKHAYNAPFEWGCLSKFLGTLPPDQWRCTMFHGLYCGYTAGLDATGKALGLAEDKRKLNTGKALIRYFCVPCAPTKANGGRTRNLPQHDTDKWELFKEYCRQDVVTEMEIERRLSAFPVPDFVQKQWETDLIINARGVAVDMDLVSGALYLGNVTRQNLTQEAMKISKLDNPNSVAQLTQWLQEAMGEELADLRKDTVARLLGKEDNSPQVQRMLEIRQELGKTSTKKYDAIEAAVCPDGRVRGLLQFYGANRTGRWAGRLVQVQNLPRTYTEPLPLARELVEHRKLDALRLIYTVTDNDETGLNFLIDKCEKDILADINQRVLPDGLFYVHVDMVAGQFLYDKKAAGGLDGLEGFDFSAPAKSITEGDVAITFAGASDGASSAEARFDALLAGLMRPPESTLAAFRRMRW